MLLGDFFTETHSSIVSNKARSALTVLGIVIGIASVIVMIAVGKGAQKSIQENIEAIGSNLLMVRPGSSFGPGSPVRSGQGSAQTLTQEDAQAIFDEIEIIKAVAPEMSGGRSQIVALGKNTNTTVTGITPEYFFVRNVEVENGEYLTQEHLDGKFRVALLGPDTATELFEENDPVGKKIRVGSTDFTVIGVLKSRGGTGFGSNDDVVYVPLTTVKQFLSGSDSLSSINVTVANQDDMETVEELISDVLMKRHNIANVEEQDFRIMNQADIVQTASSVTQTLTILLGAVAGISLVVGGIGIMNMMLTSVTERTREIGLRKAIGARKRDISKQFLFEAIFLTLIGGLVGVVLGFGISYVLEAFFKITTSATLSSAILAFVVSAAIGIVFGYYPARRAASLRPIEALRYE